MYHVKVNDLKTYFEIIFYRLNRQTKTRSSIATVTKTPITVPTALPELESVKYGKRRINLAKLQGPVNCKQL